MACPWANLTWEQTCYLGAMSLTRVDTPLTNGSGNMGNLRQARGWPLCLRRQHSLPNLFFEGQGRWPTTGSTSSFMLPFRRELYAASSRGRYGNAFSMTGVWSMNAKTQCTWHWQVEAYDVSKWVSAGIKGRLWNTSSSFLSSGDICFWSVSTMSVVKCFRRCADPCQRFLTPDDKNDICIMFLGEEHARSVLEGTECVDCELFSLGKLRSRLSLFSRELLSLALSVVRSLLALESRYAETLKSSPNWIECC